MIAFLGTIGSLFGLNPLGRAAKVAGGAALAVALALLLWGAKALYDKSVVDSHNARQDAATAKADRKADEKAGERRRGDDQRLAEEQKQLERARNEKDARNRRIARQRCIRLQQSARAAGRQPPACN